MTKGFIDNFSSKSKEYSFSRPDYPDDLFKFLSDITPNKDLVWDCATGYIYAKFQTAKDLLTQKLHASKNKRIESGLTIIRLKADGGLHFEQKE
ncbi:MAG: hypothetical protein WB443_01535 [Nitrososphaeraceae archaeon]